MSQLIRLRETIKSIDERVRACNDVSQLDGVVEETKRLELSWADESTEVPTYDKQLALAELKDLMERLRERKEVLSPVKKFRFKRKAPAAPTAPPISASPDNGSNSHAVDGSLDKNNPLPVVARNGPDVGPTTTTTNGSNSLVVCGDKTLVFTASTTRSDIDGRDIDIRDCDDQVFVFNDTTAGAMQVSNVKNSVIVCPQILSSALITGCSNCVFHVGVRQLRVFRSESLCLYLNTKSFPIIEHSSKVWVAPLAGCDEAQSQWHEVVDFNWLHKEKSPNWLVLPESSRRPPILDPALKSKTMEIEENTHLWDNSL